MLAEPPLPRRVLAALPLKPFGAAKGRLDGLLDGPARAALSRETAARVAAACRGAGAHPAVVTGDEEVAAWAVSEGLEVITEPGRGGLDEAARAAAAAAGRRGLFWCIVHADLPLLTPEEVAAVVGLLHPGRVVLAPSRNGGTNLLAADEPVAFAYGPGSLARHLAATRHLHRRIVVTVGTALDVDTPDDLRAAAALPRGNWLGRYLT